MSLGLYFLERPCDFYADVSTPGAMTIPPDNDVISWVISPDESEADACAAHGILKITTPPGVFGVHLQMDIDDLRNGYVFHVGDDPENDARSKLLVQIKTHPAKRRCRAMLA